MANSLLDKLRVHVGNGSKSWMRSALKGYNIVDDSGSGLLPNACQVVLENFPPNPAYASNRPISSRSSDRSTYFG
jgi:hypothetical protein